MSNIFKMPPLSDKPAKSVDDDFYWAEPTWFTSPEVKDAIEGDLFESHDLGGRQFLCLGDTFRVIPKIWMDSKIEMSREKVEKLLEGHILGHLHLLQTVEA